MVLREIFEDLYQWFDTNVLDSFFVETSIVGILELFEVLLVDLICRGFKLDW